MVEETVRCLAEGLGDGKLAVGEEDCGGAVGCECGCEIDRVIECGGGEGVAEGDAADGDAVVFVDEGVDGDREKPVVFEGFKAKWSARARC